MGLRSFCTSGRRSTCKSIYICMHTYALSVLPQNNIHPYNYIIIYIYIIYNYIIMISGGAGEETLTIWHARDLQYNLNNAYFLGQSICKHSL